MKSFVALKYFKERTKLCLWTVMQREGRKEGINGEINFVSAHQSILRH